MPAKKERTDPYPGTFEEASLYFSDADRTTEYVARLRWPNGPVCPWCGSTEYSYLKTRRVWKCKSCKKQYSVKKGTIFEDSPISLRKWLLAIWEIANDRNGISSHELARKLGVTQKSAWFMLHRIRLAMQTNSFEKWGDKFDGAVEVDETYIGGKARRMNAKTRRSHGIDQDRRAHLTEVVGFRQRDGKVAAAVLPVKNKQTLHKEVRKRVKPDATVITDELKGYGGLDAHYQHQVVNHIETYVDGQVHTNGVENFWSLLKRGLGGTYISVRPFHLFRYLDEQVYRYNSRTLPDATRVSDVMRGIEGRRLTYKELTGKHREPPEPPGIPPRRLPNYPLGPF